MTQSGVLGERSWVTQFSPYPYLVRRASRDQLELLYRAA